MDKKIAICFYGQVRDFDILNLLYKPWMKIKDYNVDFFISSWDDFDLSRLHINFKEANYFNLLEYKEGFNTLTREVTEKNLNQDLSPIYVAFHQQNVLKSKIEYETKNKIKYDFTILVRPDFYLEPIQTFKHIDNLFKSNLHNIDKPIVSLKGNITANRGSLELDGDAFYIENRLGALYHSTIYSDIFKNKKFKEFSIRYINGTHNLYYTTFLANSFFLIRNNINSVIYNSLYGRK